MFGIREIIKKLGRSERECQYVFGWAFQKNYKIKFVFICFILKAS